MTRIKVLVVDDHPVVRAGLKTVIDLQPDMRVVGEAGDGREALECTERLQPDVVLLDIGLPGLNGFEVARHLQHAHPATRIVALSIFDQEAYVSRFLQAGARGYVLKGADSEEIMAAVRAAIRGEYYVSSQLRAGLVDRFLQARRSQRQAEPYDLLSEREQQVFRMLVEGHSTGAIAGLLHVSPKTVEKHRVNIQRKLGTKDLVAMVKYAVRIGVVDPELWKE